MDRKKKIFLIKTSPLSPVENERGSILMITMLILVMLTLVGIAAMNTSTLETLVAGNERTYKENFYRAEAAAMAGGQKYVNLAKRPISDMDFDSAGSEVSDFAKVELQGNTSWSSPKFIPNEDFLSISEPALDANSRYHIVYLDNKGNDAGLSEGPERYYFKMIGQSDIKNGSAAVEATASVVVN